MQHLYTHGPAMAAGDEDDGRRLDPAMRAADEGRDRRCRRQQRRGELTAMASIATEQREVCRRFFFSKELTRRR